MKGVIKKLFAGAVLSVGLLILGNSALAAETPEAAATGAVSITSTSATLKASINPGGASTEYKMEYGTSTSFGYSTVWHTSGSGSYVNYETETINGLSAGTTYYYRVIARNSVGTVTSSYTSFTTTGSTGTTGESPEAAATGASSVSSSSAALGGLVDANGLSTRYWMEYGPTSSLGYSTGTYDIGSDTYAKSVSQTINGLSSGTTYYYVVKASNSRGTVTSSSRSFTTSGSGTTTGESPEAAATGASSVSSSSATLQGLVNSNGLTTRYWMEYGPTSSLGYSTGTYDIGSDTYAKSVSQTVSGLSSGTTYYYVVKASNSRGTVTSSSRSFTTSGGTTTEDGAPEVSATGTSRISDTSVYLNGVVDPNGNYTEYWFEYGQGNDMSNSTSRNSAGSGMSSTSVSRSISGLSSGTTYRFVLKASNSRGTVTSSSYSFTTSSGSSDGGNNGGWGMGWAPIVITNSAQNVSGSSADLVGRVNPNGNYTEYWFEYGIGDSLDKKTTRWHLNPMSGETAVTTFVGNLNSATTYKFRLMASNGYGTDSGSLLSFTTTGNSNYMDGKPVAVTYLASNVSQNAAILHSRINPSGSATTAWFEYGVSTSNLNMRTLGQNTGSDHNDRSASAVITGLSAGTTYYFRVVASNASGITYGDIKYLKTAAGYYRPVTPPVKPTVIVDTSTGTDVAGADVMLDPSVNRLEPAPGEEVDYTLTYRNAGSSKLSDVQIKVSLPMEVEFIDSNLKTASRSGNNLTFSIGEVAKNSQGSITIKVKVKSDVKGGNSVMFNAFMEYLDSNKKFQTIDSYISIVVKGTETDVQPNGFLGSLSGLAKAMSGSWLFIILLLLILIALIYLIVTRKRDARNS